MMLIREPRLLDMPAIREMWRGWFAERPVPHREENELVMSESRAMSRVLSGESKGIALYSPACAVLFWPAEADGVLVGHGVYIDPRWRGMGRGTQIVQHALALAKDRGFKRVAVTPYFEDHKVMKWLHGIGFGPTQLVMTKEL